jgi:hypothetical protein
LVTGSYQLLDPVDRFALQRLRQFLCSIRTQQVGARCFSSTSTQENYSRLNYPGAEWQYQPSAGSRLYNAYCIGRSAGQAGNRPEVQVRLMGVHLIDGLHPTSSTNVSTMIVSNLEKQVSKASVIMNWNFQE